MQIDIKNPAQILSHVLLNDDDLVEKVIDTKEWKDEGLLTATVFINGVEVSAQSFEKTLQFLFDQIESNYSEKYDANNIDKLVEDKAKQLLKEHADNALEKISNLERILEESEDLIKPYWERG